MNTLFVGNNIIELKQVHSTNSYASELLKKSILPEGTIIWSKNQTNGRGQRGNSWESEPFKNIAFSIVLYPKFLSVEKQFYLNKIIALAIADFVADLLLKNGQTQDVKIKWPNDIYVNNKKIAGILIENILKNNIITSAVIGVGININQTEFSLVASKATSLKNICEIEFSLDKTLNELCSYIESRYLQLIASKWDIVAKDYVTILFRYNTWATYKKAETPFIAKIKGVSIEGKLILETELGKELCFGLKEIEFII